MESKFDFQAIYIYPPDWGLNVSLDQLYNCIKYASDRYYNSSEVVLEDEDFDKLVDIYNARSPKKYEEIGSQLNDKNKCKLPFHMGSMNKTKSLKDLSKWILKQRNNNKVESFVITPKIDGTSALIIFELNSLKNLDIKIYTRGDGDVGKRIDFLAEYLIPETLRSQIIELACRSDKPVAWLRCSQQVEGGVA